MQERELNSKASSDYGIARFGKFTIPIYSLASRRAIFKLVLMQTNGSGSIIDGVNSATGKLDRARPGAYRLVVTAGPTCEDIDAVRFITNRSTGTMGTTLADRAQSQGLAVLLILGPSAVAVPEGLACVRVRSAEEMRDAVMAALPWCNGLVMTAAVADYTPAEPFSGKLKKSDGELVLRLKRTPDILKTVSESADRGGKTIIGFALEPEINLEEGRRKLESKKLDGIIVNTCASFGSEKMTAVFVDSAGNASELGEIGKAAMADYIINHIKGLR